MAAAFSFAVPSTIPQDLQLIQEIIGDIPPPSSSKISEAEHYSDHDHGTDSETDSEKEVEADILGEIQDEDDGMPSEKEYVIVLIRCVVFHSLKYRRGVPSESTSDSDSSSESEPDSEEAETQKRAPKRIEVDAEDDEEGDAAGPSETQVRTKNEVVEVDIIIPDISEVGPHEQLEKVGEVMSIVDRVVIVKGIPSDIANRGSEKALDSDTLLVFEDRKVLGYVRRCSSILHCNIFTKGIPDFRDLWSNKRTTIPDTVQPKVPSGHREGPSRPSGIPCPREEQLCLRATTPPIQGQRC